MNAPNLNYLYNVEYFDEIFKAEDAGTDARGLKDRILRLNKDLAEQKTVPDSRMQTLSNMDGFHSFDLDTTYPGLLIGIGYPHDISQAGAIKTGLSLDYVTGAPYLPGSSLKGQIRSWFPDDGQDTQTQKEKTELIRSFLGEGYESLDVSELRDWIFVNKVVFLGGYFNSPKAAPLDMDYITPHNKGKFKNPIPINIMRIKPGMRFRFCFIIPDYPEKDITGDQLADLFKEIILFGGIGAKTNTGYGRMADPHAGVRKKRPVKIGICPKCKGDVIWKEDGPCCSSQCGLRMGEVYHIKLTKKQMTDFLADRIIEIVNAKGQTEHYRKGEVKRVFSKKTGKPSEIIDAKKI